MKLKGINPLEQHAEKIVVGVFAVALLGVAAWQFLSPAPTVKVGTKEVPMPDAYSEVAKEARRIEAKLKQAEPEGLPTGAGAALAQLENFDKRLTASVSPSPRLAVAIGPGSDVLSGAGGRTLEVATYNEITIDAPGEPVGATHIATIDRSEIAADPAVQAVLPAKDPLDKASISVEIKFDGTALRTAMMADPDGEGPIRALPKNWWDGRMQVLGVEWRRQMLKPDGTWTDPEPVKIMPGRAALVDKLDGLNTADALRSAANFATTNADYVRRPPYYAVRLGEQWTAPAQRSLMAKNEAEKQREITKLTQQREGEQRKLKQQEDALAKVGQAPPPPAGGGGGGGGGKTGGGGLGGGGGGGGSAPPPPPTGQNSIDAQKRGIQTRIDQTKKRIAEIEAKLAALGVKVGDAMTASTDTTASPTKSEAPLLDNADVQLWGHDVHVERGRTYRYQAVVALTNPYFGYSAAMTKEQGEKLATKGVIRSAPSAWSEPIAVDPETYLFFTTAVADDGIGGRTASAKAEVFQFAWGHWRKGDDSLEPGDSIATELKIPDFSAMLANPDPAQVPGAPPPGDGGRGGGGGGGGKLGGGGAGAAAPEPPKPQDRPVAAPGTAAPTTTVQITDPRIMLGVGQGAIVDQPGKPPKAVTQVLVREDDGRISVRIPELEKANPTYARVSQSAEKGVRETTPPAAPRTPRTPNRPDAQPGSGGDGGRDDGRSGPTGG